MLPLGNEFAAFSLHTVCHSSLSNVRKEFACGKKLTLGPDNALLAVEIHKRHAMGAKRLPFHCEVAGRRGE